MSERVALGRDANRRRRQNLEILFNNTTIIPFKGRGSFKCFYCGKAVIEYHEFRKHTITHNPCSIHDRAIKVVKTDEAEVRVDVSIIKCEICNEAKDNFDGLVDHLIDEHSLMYDKEVKLFIVKYKLDGFDCVICDQHCTSLIELLTHVSDDHDKTKINSCTECRQKFRKKGELDAHTKTYHKKEYKCSKCSLSFPSYFELHNHNSNSHIATCNICFIPFPTAKKMLQHLKLEHGDDDLRCGFCDKVVSTKIGFLKHASKCTEMEKKHSQEHLDDFVGLHPDFFKTSNGTKKVSVKTIRNNIACLVNNSTAVPFKFFKNRFRCFYCPKDFNDCDALKEHTKNEHPHCDTKFKCMLMRNRESGKIKVDVSSLFCKLCFVPMKDLETLIDHLISEHKSNFDKSVDSNMQAFSLVKDRFLCPFCGEVFRYFSTVLKHISQSHSNNNAVCMHCGATFRNVANLRAHIHKHHRPAAVCRVKENKIFECSVCQEKFSSRYPRDRHMIDVHESGHKCSHCGKLFTRNSQMVDHVRRTHLKEKNVHCQICRELFFEVRALRLHMVRHCGERNFQCDVCDKKFLWKKSLISHMTTHYKNANVVGPARTHSYNRRRNLQILFNNTSLCPFKWRGKYLCFFCGEDISHYDELKIHTKGHIPCSDKDRAILLVKAVDAEVKIDVSDNTCEICNESFSKLDDIVDHLIEKHDLPYDKDVKLSLAVYRLLDLQCLLCDEKFDYFNRLVSHVNTRHPSESFECSQCLQIFNKKRDMDAHLRMHHRNEHNCSKCSLSFTSYAAFKKHIANSHISTCNVCFKSFSSLKRRLKHMKFEHADDVLECGFCFKTMSTKQSFLRHATKCNTRIKNVDEIPVEDDEKKPSVHQIRNNVACILNMSTAIPFKYFMSRFRCFYCPKDFNECSDLRQHTVTEHPHCDIKLKSMKLRNRHDGCIKIDIASLSCKLCILPMQSLEALIEHLVTNHKARYDKSIDCNMQPYKLIKDNFACPLCGEVYRYFSSLLRHVGNFHTDNKYICVYCGKSFRNVSNLRAHVSSKHNTAVYKCSKCDMELTSNSHLQTHLGTAHGAKVIQCLECEEKFISNYRMQRHMVNVHSSGHKCAYCGKLFTRNSLMVNHVRRTHLKEKNVECSVCFERFFDGHRLKIHMVKHYGERNFHCDVCGKKFLWKKNLRGHMSSHIKKTSQMST